MALLAALSDPSTLTSVTWVVAEQKATPTGLSKRALYIHTHTHTHTYALREAASLLVLYTFHHRCGRGWGKEKLQCYRVFLVSKDKSSLLEIDSLY